MIWECSESLLFMQEYRRKTSKRKQDRTKQRLVLIEQEQDTEEEEEEEKESEDCVRQKRGEAEKKIVNERGGKELTEDIVSDTESMDKEMVQEEHLVDDDALSMAEEEMEATVAMEEESTVQSYRGGI